MWVAVVAILTDMLCRPFCGFSSPFGGVAAVHKAISLSKLLVIRYLKIQVIMMLWHSLNSVWFVVALFGLPRLRCFPRISMPVGGGF